MMIKNRKKGKLQQSEASKFLYWLGCCFNKQITQYPSKHNY